VLELFVNAEGTAMTRAGFEYILDKHVCTARISCPSWSGRSVSPHQLRHSCALRMLQATRDIRKAGAVARFTPTSAQRKSTYGWIPREVGGQIKLTNAPWLRRCRSACAGADLRHPTR
jgi:hypothetical protein